MKKTYQNPEMKIVKIQTHHLMAGSEKLGIGGSFGGDNSKIQSRGAAFWDDEDE